MIYYFKKAEFLYILSSNKELSQTDIEKIIWLFGDAIQIDKVNGIYLGPHSEMITPWSTNAVEITQNIGINGIERIEQFYKIETNNISFDKLQQRIYNNIDENIFANNIKPEPIIYVENIAEFNASQGLAMSLDEIEYLEEVSKKLNRKLTDSEVFGFSQVNSEHCRHKIFNGKFILNDIEKEHSLFQIIKSTSSANKGRIVSAYTDNVAFIQGPVVQQFYPLSSTKSDFFTEKKIETVISLKAETHNFPTTVEPFNGAATGSGGEIRDRLAGGKGSIPLAGTAVYMTSYPRNNDSVIKQKNNARKWLYQTPDQILIKASNGASDFGNKFGQPLICGSVLTFEHQEGSKTYGFDKVIMQAGGIGFANKNDSFKEKPQKGDIIVVMGGDNYRIGMGGGAVSSVNTGEYKSSIELNAVQRSNPEMQKRVYNAIRAMSEMDNNPIVSIHDHGAGGHLNSLSELVEDNGGIIDINKLPIGDKTLSAKEIIGNESQERMGLVIKEKDLSLLKAVSQREKAPIYDVGIITDDYNFSFVDYINNSKPLDMPLKYLLGKTPKTIIKDNSENFNLEEIAFDENNIEQYIINLLSLESVGCKDWLTNKVDRSVTGKVALQQTAGKLQLPINNLGVMALDYQGEKGVATSIGHAPIAGLIDVKSAMQLSVVEALTNIIWVPIQDEIKGISLSANWMWPCKNPGEDDRLYNAVEAISDFAIKLGINIPTGKDSLSMTQKYPDGNSVVAPGTVIISAVGEVTDIKKVVTADLKPCATSSIIYVDFSDCDFEIGGSAFAQSLNKIGNKTPHVKSTEYIVNCFNTIQKLIQQDCIIAGHDVSSGGLITTVLEMCFASNNIGMDLDLTELPNDSLVKILMSEKPAIVIQVNDIDKVSVTLNDANIRFYNIGRISFSDNLSINGKKQKINLSVANMRKHWYLPSYYMEKQQTSEQKANERLNNIFNQPREFKFPEGFDGKISKYKIENANRLKNILPKVAIIREKGVNGDREMAWGLYLAGFDVKDVHMSDLMNGSETLENINMVVFVGGFSNSDVLGSAKGWAGTFMFNENAKNTLSKFYNRKDTLSLGICNGCQLMTELNLLTAFDKPGPKLTENDSKKFESNFISVTIPKNNSVMLQSLEGSVLGVWVAHFEGKFNISNCSNDYNIAMQYSYSQYPGNPNGSPNNIAAICSSDGRHLAMMPHIERAVLPWQWAFYGESEKHDVSPWFQAFVNAREWIEKNTSK